jgi:hypothetical protein
MYLENEWMHYAVTDNNFLLWKISEESERRIKQEHSSWTDELLRSNLLESTFRLGRSLGDNIFVSLSGGSDSQCACLALQQAGVPFTAAILVFDNDFNKVDVDSAVNFCKVYNIKYITYDIDIMGFLAKELPIFVDRYQCPSPQISTHLWFYEQLIKNYSPSSIVCGGHAPYITENLWAFGSSRSQSAWMTFKDVNNFNIIGNYRGHSFDIAIAFMMAQKNIANPMPDEDKRCPVSYANKIQGMYNLGFNVLPQEKKMTGFEEIKIMLKEKVRAKFIFDKWYRDPYKRKYKDYGSKFQLDPEIVDILTNSVNSIAFSKTCINTYNRVE